MIADAVLAMSLHLHHGERPAHVTEARIIAAAAKVPPRWRQFARCVERRESRGIATARNRSGAAGLFQFMPAWQHGLPYMVAERLRQHGMSLATAKALRKHLSVTPINQWPAQLQRVGFAAAITVPGNDRHWALRGSVCEGFR